MGKVGSIGGCAILNGIILMDTASGRVVCGVRNGDGTVHAEKLAFLSKAATFLKIRTDRIVLRLPATARLLNTLSMLLLSILMLFAGLGKGLSFKSPWPFRKAAAFALLAAAICMYIFFETYVTLLLSLGFILFFARDMGIMLGYHGAEHKVINMYESGVEVSEATIEAIRPFSRIHLRCGTNLAAVLVPLILIDYFAVESGLFFNLSGGIDLLLSFLLLLLGVEIFKRLQRKRLQWLLKPGLLLQKGVTTREPDDGQLEVALETLKVLTGEG